MIFYINKMVETKDILKVLFLNNPDKVFYNELDSVMIKHLEEEGLSVSMVELQDINFEIKTGESKLFIKNKETKINGFLAYGWMSPLHYKAYTYLVATFETMGVTCLHNYILENILTDKYLQSLKFAIKNVPVPTTYQGYSVSAFKDIAERAFENDQFSIFKRLNDYGGEGIKRCETKELLVNNASKLLWRNEYCVFQKYVSDSVGKSIRVLCINGKAIAIAEYNDKSGSFLSNVSYGDYFKLNSFMEHPKYKEYANLGELAVSSLGPLIICGVDILDSPSIGMVVLECNGFPDIFDISASTEVNVFKLFAEAYKQKIEVK